MTFKRLLTERNPHVSCIWNHCDPVTTAAVQGVSPDGSRSNCGRTNKDGVTGSRVTPLGLNDTFSYGRRRKLLEDAPNANTSYSVKDSVRARQLMETGEIEPLTADTWYALFERIEADQKGKVLSSCVRSEIEHKLVTEWSGEQNHADAPHGDIRTEIFMGILHIATRTQTNRRLWGRNPRSNIKWTA